MEIKTKSNWQRGRLFPVFIIAGLIFTYACSTPEPLTNVKYSVPEIESLEQVNAPSPDPREGLKAGLFDAGEAIWNLELQSSTPPPKDFVGVSNSDLAFYGDYAIQGNYNGFIVWDISDPYNPDLVKDFLCPASQSDVSVYGNLLFVSGEGLEGRLDCGTEGVSEAVSKDRLRGIRIFDITDIKNPLNVANVQTCRGSHTHSVLKDPDDDENVYIYVSGSAGVRPEEELPGCSDLQPEEDPNTALFRIEIIKVPLDAPEDAAIVNSPRIFENLVKAPQHGLTDDNKKRLQAMREDGQFPYVFETVVGPFIRTAPPEVISEQLKRIVAARDGEGIPTSADSSLLRENIQSIMDQLNNGTDSEGIVRKGPDQCHDITLYPEIGLAGGACEGYGLLLDITDPVNPKRIDAVADSNFSYWHSATFTNDGSKILFTDEWGGGGQPKCRETDPYEWGANALFTVKDNKMNFTSYYKLPAAQTAQENCVAHNGSMIPVPGRDIMVQSWYQGGISVFDWTDPENPVEIAFHDRGPVSAESLQGGGSWSVYWYNGTIVSSEIARGLDLFKLTPSPYLTKNEIAAANTVTFDYLNAQGQQKYEWPATFALAKAYVDQLDRNNGLTSEEIRNIRQQLANAEASGNKQREKILKNLAQQVEQMATSSDDSDKVKMLATTVKNLTLK